MDERAQIPVSLPRDEPTTSYWQDPPSDLADARSTVDLPEKVDIAIIGSGITGAAIAWHLLGPDAEARDKNNARVAPSVVMLEARKACSGATGRNGGHTKAASYRSFLDNQATLGTTEAVKIARLELANINAMHAFARDQHISCESRPCQTLDVIYDEAHWREAHKAVAAMRAALGGDTDPAAEYAFHSPEAVRAQWHVAGTDARAPVGGVSYAAGSVSAYRLGVGVLRRAVQLGLNLQTNTPVTELVQVDGGWIVCTPRGALLATRVVLATNGYTAHLWKGFQGAVVPLRGQVTAHRPGGNMPAGGLPGTYSFIYEDGYEYMVPRPASTSPTDDDAQFAADERAGDIIIGGGLARAPQEGLFEYGTTDDTTLSEDISKYLYETTARYFGENWGDDHPDGRIRREWTGIMGYSPDGFPFVGEVPGQKGLWASCSFQGHGMVYCWMCAKGMVEMMQARVDDEQDPKSKRDLDEWFPEVFKITQERMSKRFQGRLHTSAAVESL